MPNESVSTLKSPPEEMMSVKENDPLTPSKPSLSDTANDLTRGEDVGTPSVKNDQVMGRDDWDGTGGPDVPFQEF